MAEEHDDAADEGVKGSKQRSPNYPMFSLKKAVDLAKVLHDKYKKSLVPIHLAQSLWGYKEHSGAGNQAVGALKAFGLIDVDGKAKDRRIRLTERAVRIVLGSPDREEQLRKAALSPQMYEELWERHKAEESFPDDELLKHYLVWDREGARFNIETVDGFLSDFRDSLRYSGLQSAGIIRESGASGGEEDDDLLPPPPVAAYARKGDLVNISVGPGKYKYSPKNLRRVVGLSEDGEWVFVEDEPAGFPKEQVFVMTQNLDPVRVQQLPPVNPFAMPKPEQTPPPTKDGELRLPIPMIGGGMATLNVPIPMTVKNFNYLKAMVGSMLDGMKEALIVQDATIQQLASNASLVAIGPMGPKGTAKAVDFGDADE